MALPRPHSLALVAALASTLPGCAAQGDFPSLQPRPIEQNVTTEEPVRERAAVESNPALRARAAELLALARRGERAFEAAYGPASAAAARAGAAGSEGWTVAQQAISRVEAARDDTSSALAELDQLLVARSAQPTNQEDFAILHSAAAEAQRLAGAQQARLARLRSSVRSR